MYLVKVFLSSLIISAIVYIAVMRFVFNDPSEVNIILGIIAGTGCGIGMVQLCWKKAYPESFFLFCSVKWFSIEAVLILNGRSDIDYHIIKTKSG